MKTVLNDEAIDEPQRRTRIDQEDGAEVDAHVGSAACRIDPCWSCRVIAAICLAVLAGTLAGIPIGIYLHYSP